MAPRVLTLPIRVYWEDTDASGIVYHASYLRYMERARTEFLRGGGFEQSRMTADGSPLIVVSDLSVRFRRPARLDDLLEVRTRLRSLGRASVVFQQDIYRGPELLTTAEVRCAAVDRRDGRPTAMPGALRELCLAFSPDQPER